MSDWTIESTPKPPPGATVPAPGPLTPGWTDWLREIVPPTGGDPPQPIKSIALSVDRGGHYVLALEGDSPGAWEADKTFKTGEGKDYRDFTRFRRIYPRIVLQWYFYVDVTVVVTYNDGSTWAPLFQFMFSEPDGEPHVREGYRLYTWRLSSGWRELPINGDTVGGVWEYDWTDQLSEFASDPEPHYTELNESQFWPPKGLLKHALEKKFGYVIEEDEESGFAMRLTDGEVVRGLRWGRIPPDEIGFAYWADAEEIEAAAARRVGIEGIEGIGPRHVARLRDLGVTSIADLATLDVASTTVPGVSSSRLERWRTMAGLSRDYPQLTGNDVEVLANLGVESRAAVNRREVEVTRGALGDAVSEAKLPRGFDKSRLIHVLGL